MATEASYPVQLFHRAGGSDDRWWHNLGAGYAAVRVLRPQGHSLVMYAASRDDGGTHHQQRIIAYPILPGDVFDWLDDATLSRAEPGFGEEFELCFLDEAACAAVCGAISPVTRDETIQLSDRTTIAIAALISNYGKARNAKSGIKRHGWRRPLEGYVKLNIDVAFNLDQETGATGAIIRDESRNFMAASNSRVVHVNSAASAEARALRDGLILAGQIGCIKLIINSDCIEVVQTMQDGGISETEASAIYEECNFLARDFNHVIIEHCPREGNVVAHSLAAEIEGSQT